MGLGNFWASVIAVLITLCLVALGVLGLVKGVSFFFGTKGGETNKGCDFRSWEVIAEPINGEGLVKLWSDDDFYVELPFSEGDTVTRFFDDREWNVIIEKAESVGTNMDKHKFKVISIKKNCF